MSKTPLVSVVIPTYNRASTLERALDSVVNQTYKNLEIVVIDDCSSDGTKALIDNYKDYNVIYIRNKKNSGACASRNKGITVSSGEYIALLDSDDSWRPNKIKVQLDAINENNCDVCFCRFERHNYSEKIKTIWPQIDAGIVKRADLIQSSKVSTQTIFAKRELFLNNLFNPDMPRLQDYEWVIRTSVNHSFLLVDEVLVDVYLQDDSITNNGKEKLLEAYLAILDRDLKYVNDQPALAAFLFAAAGDLIASLNKNPASFYRKALRLNWSFKIFIKLLLTYFGIYK